MSKKQPRNLKGTPEYSSWVSMRMRCRSPQGHDVIYYANISVCSEWDDPVVFVTDMGPKPSPSHQIDRIDNTQGYCKENCRWVDKTTQMQNTRIAKWWYVDGVKYPSVAVAAKSIGVAVSRIKAWCDGRTDGGYTYPPKANCWSEKKYGQ
jgi:hypothetical protein